MTTDRMVDAGLEPESSAPEPESSAPEPASSPAAVPPDPTAYDHPRAVRARARGLSAPYIPGGRDPDAEKTAVEERRLLRILVVFVIVLVLSGFVLGAIGVLVSAVLS